MDRFILLADWVRQAATQWQIRDDSRHVTRSCENALALTAQEKTRVRVRKREAG